LQIVLTPAGEAMLEQVSASVGADDLKRAAEISDAALAAGNHHPVFFNARALLAQSQGNEHAALDEFEKALLFTPQDPLLLKAIGMSLVRLNRSQEGVGRFDMALRFDPNDAQIYYFKGWALAASGDQDGAKRAYERAVTLQPDYPAALAALATHSALTGELSKARQLAGRALAGNPRDPGAVIALAICDIAEGEDKAAERRLKVILDDRTVVGNPRSLSLGYYGDALDGMGRFAEAFAAYRARNEEVRALNAERLSRQKSRAIVESLTDYLRRTPAEPWTMAPPGEVRSRAREHVFLMGFLRSGTTLLEQVLAVHPDVAVLEERETLFDVSRTYLASNDAMDRFMALSGDELDRLRTQYWRKVESFGVNTRRRGVLDKQPLNAVNLPLIARLFPHAKILFAIRDPRDVLLSCFRRHFDVTAVMFDFLRLEDGARFYSAVMDLAEVARAKLPLDLLEHRYEDMIADFEGRVRRVCDYLGIEWTDEMRDFSAAAQSRSIRSPSANQVRRDLYRSSVESWRNYAPQMAAALPTLEPWVQRYGYPPSGN
jgi:Flp pilus assembly protein TadD